MARPNKAATWIVNGTLTLLGVVSLLLFLLWLLYAISLISSEEVGALPLDLVANIFQKNYALAVHNFRTIFALIGGSFGWIAFILLIKHRHTPWTALPLYLKTGLGTGITAALLFPAAIGLGLPPVFFVLILRQKLKRIPNHPTSPKN